MTPRFYHFVRLIERIHKSIGKLKLDTAPYFGVKSVHIFWIYELYSHPEGLIAAELASNSMISRSLISREIERLQKDGYVEIFESNHGKRKNYHARILLTPKGKKLAESIFEEGMGIQSEVSRGISQEELLSFYQTLEKLCHNLEDVAKRRENDVRL